MKKLAFLAVMLMSVSAFTQSKVKYSKEELRVMDNYLFDEVFTGASIKKPSTVVLKDGRTVEGTYRSVDTDKGLISAVTLKDDSGKQQTFTSDQIAEMYLPVNEMSKAIKMGSYFSKVNNWGSKSLSKVADRQQTYFRNQNASVRNKKTDKQYMMQLINPQFSEIIEVYGDPRARETGGVSFGGGPQIGGGVIKAFYVSKGGKTIWIEKSDFEEQYDFLFGDNPEFMKKYPLKSVEWPFFSFLVMKYTEMSQKD